MIVQMLGHFLGYKIDSPRSRYRVYVPYGVVDSAVLEEIATDAAEAVVMSVLWLVEMRCFQCSVNLNLFEARK